MECTGRLHGVTKDWNTDKFLVTFFINEDMSNEAIENIRNCEKLSIVAEKWKQKRSLDANAYFHVLVGKIAEATTNSKAKQKNILLCKYGQPELMPDGSPMVYKTNAPVEYMLELESIHSIPIKYAEEKGKEVVFYKIYRGSHTYNSYEMSKLIEGTVADAKELGIETLTPRELAIMNMRWEKKHG